MEEYIGTIDNRVNVSRYILSSGTEIDLDCFEQEELSQLLYNPINEVLKKENEELLYEIDRLKGKIEDLEDEILELG